MIEQATLDNAKFSAKPKSIHEQVHGDKYTSRPKKRRKGKRQAMLLKWDTSTEQLLYQGEPIKNSIIAKAFDFLENNCYIHLATQQTPEGYTQHEWHCKYIEGYNTTTYTLLVEEQGTNRVYRCNCQYCNKEKKPCSHITGLCIYNKDYPSDGQIIVEGEVHKKLIRKKKEKK